MITTAPAAGVPTAFRLSAGGCYFRTTTTGGRVPPLVQAQAPDFLVLQDDISYDDNIDGDRDAFLARLAAAPADTKRSQRYFTRALRKWPEMAALFDAVPIYPMIGDHDFVSNDSDWDTVLSGSDYPTVSAAVRGVFIETSPLPTLLDPQGRVMAYKWDWAATRHVMMDVQSQRRSAATPPTMLGRSSGHELVNQFDLVTGAITQAGIDGRAMVFLYSPCTIVPAHDGWLAGGTPQFGAEWTALCNVMKATQDAHGTRFVLIAGDSHACGADDGGNVDWSTGGMAIPPVHFVCSPWNSASLTAGSAYYSWNGAPAFHAVSDEQMAVIDVSADNRHVTVSFYNCASGSAVLMGSYTTTDLTAWAA